MQSSQGTCQCTCMERVGMKIQQAAFEHGSVCNLQGEQPATLAPCAQPGRPAPKPRKRSAAARRPRAAAMAEQTPVRSARTARTPTGGSWRVGGAQMSPFDAFRFTAAHAGMSPAAGAAVMQLMEG